MLRVTTILDAPSTQWRQTARAQIAGLDRLIEQAQRAQTFLTSALGCPTAPPTAPPAGKCAVMIEALDDLVGGASVDPARSRARDVDRQ